jgi:DNA-binding CsgD family transcriptional regulator
MGLCGVERVDRLTERQKECLRLVGNGFTSKEIAPMLSISPATVDNHIRAALEILQVTGRAEAARLLGDAGQRLTSQPADLAQPLDRTALDGAADGGGRSWLHQLIPPLGGQRNTLGAEHKIFAIVMVAVLGLASVIILALAVAVLLWLAR